MTRSSTHTANVSVAIEVNGEGLDLIAEVRFTYYPGSPGTGPTYSCGWTPPDPDEVSDIEVLSIRNEDTGELLTPPRWLRTFIEDNADIDALAESATEDRDYAYERAMEMRAEMQREDREYERKYGSVYAED